MDEEFCHHMHKHGMDENEMMESHALPLPERNSPGRMDHSEHAKDTGERRAGHVDRHADHTGGGHAHHDPAVFLRKFWLSLALTIPVLLYSPHFLDMLGISFPIPFGNHFVAPVLGTIIFFYGGMVFLTGARSELKQGLPGMMTLISLAICVAYFYSLAVSFGLPGEEIYWELSTLIVIMLLGHWLELSAVSKAGSALDEMVKLLPDTALKITGDKLEDVPLEQVRPGDLLLLRPGARVPADGVIIEGEGSFNESMITGESKSVYKKGGDLLVAGTVSEDGSLRMQVVRSGAETYLAGIIRLIREAEASRSHTQILADRAAYWLVIVAVSSALATALAWFVSGAATAFITERVVTVLVTACPHALGLAIPLVVAISTTMTARSGLLVRNRTMLEEAWKVNYVVFDKTGTLTQGKYQVTGVFSAGRLDKDTIIGLAAAAEFEAEHMVARAIRTAAEENQVVIPFAKDYKNMAGRGVSAVIDGAEVYVGGPNLISLLGTEIPFPLISPVQEAEKLNQSYVYLIVNGTMEGLLSLADVVKSESREAVAVLQSMGIKVAMLTGDNESVAAAVANELGIDKYFAGVLPDAKSHIIKELQADKQIVAMVGDGINDAPALAQSDVSIAIGAGTDIAIESAGIILVSSDPGGVIRLFKISKAAYVKMLQNLAWATGYNAVVIPLAAGILAPWGFVLPMAAGAVIMSISTIIVAVNAQLLKIKNPGVR